MRPAVRDRERALEIVRSTPVAGWCYQSRQVGIDAPTDYKVEHVARDKPRDYKHPKYDIANSSEAEVFETFSKLFWLSVRSHVVRFRTTYGKRQINHVHQHQNQVADPSLVVGV
jgi:hypothetical protein